MRAVASNQKGFTYLAVLVAVVVISIGTAAVSEIWITASRRDRERELLHAGRELRAAIGRYYEQAVGGVRRYPGNLEDLLKDKRFPGIKRHLRSIYRDPMTNSEKWGVIPAPGGGIMGVHSLSDDEPIKTDRFRLGEENFIGKKKYSEWRFVYIPTVNPNVLQARPILPVPAPAEFVRRSERQPATATTKEPEFSTSDRY